MAIDSKRETRIAPGDPEPTAGQALAASDAGPRTAIERARQFALPPRIEANDIEPERQIAFKELVGAGDIVLIGVHGRDFDPGKGMCRRILWQWADHYRSVGADRDFALSSLVDAESIPAREAAAVQASGQPVLCRVEQRESRKNPGNVYYVLV